MYKKSFSCKNKTAIVTGGADIVLKIRAKDIDEMDKFVTQDIRNVAGIERTQTMILLHEI